MSERAQNISLLKEPSELNAVGDYKHPAPNGADQLLVAIVSNLQPLLHFVIDIFH